MASPGRASPDMGSRVRRWYCPAAHRAATAPGLSGKQAWCLRCGLLPGARLPSGIYLGVIVPHQVLEKARKRGKPPAQGGGRGGINLAHDALPGDGGLMVVGTDSTILNEHIACWQQLRLASCLVRDADHRPGGNEHNAGNAPGAPDEQNFLSLRHGLPFFPSS